MTVCALSGGQMEKEYLELVRPYGNGEVGRRAIDAFPAAVGDLIVAMEKTRKDILGDIYQGAISYGHNGQFFTPEPVCEAMARMSMEQASGRAARIIDPCCGSGRLLLAAADVNPHAEFYGQDIDLRCVRMTAINLALRNLYGQVILGNSLSDERRLVYQTGFNGKGFIAQTTPAECPAPVRKAFMGSLEKVTPTISPEPVETVLAESPAVGTQLTLF